jgi:hypothetical protein
MNARIFLSYAEMDKNKVKALRRAIRKRRGLDPIIAAEQCRVGHSLTDKVKECLRKADCLMPILTRQSINSQWMNQEIGFAVATEIPIVPLVEQSLFDRLKGFVNNQIDLPFAFAGAESDSKKEARNFRRCYVAALEYIGTSPQIAVAHDVEHGRLQITQPAETYVSTEYVEISGINAKPGAAVVVVTSLFDRHLAAQKGYAIADSLGNWKYPRCHLFNIDKDRTVYAIAVDAVYEQKLRELLAIHRNPPRDRVMDSFRQILIQEQVPFEISLGKRLVRTKARAGDRLG